MIYVKMTGGLGNQLFQYALGRVVQLKTNNKLCLDFSEFNDQKDNHNAVFNGTLSNFNVKYDRIINTKREFITDTKSMGVIYFLIDKFLNFILHIFRYEGRGYFEKIFQFRLNKRGYFFSRDGYVDIFPEKCESKDIFLKGYWQSEKYFYEYRDILKSEIVVRTRIKDENVPYISLIKKKNSVCVHIRLGDYLKNGKVHCSEKYYIEAIKYIRERENDAVFFIFSDDIEFVMSNFQLPECNHVFMVNKNESFEELRLMINCRHFVISNSSFSWWAQYLGGYEDKIVVAPKPWFKRIPSDIAMKEWITIGVFE